MVSVIQIFAVEGILLDDVDSNACLIMPPSSFGSSSWIMAIVIVCIIVLLFATGIIP